MTLYNHCEQNNNMKLLTEWERPLLPVSDKHTLQILRQCDEKEKTDGKPRIDIIGKRFGRLVVLKYIKTKKESTWECLCDCGNTKVIAQSKLQKGTTTSCGCFQEEIRKGNFKKNIHFVDGTCIELVAAKVTFKTNTSGFRGVYQRENGKYRSRMTFKGKRHELGSYDTFEEAVKARLKGEKMIDEFIADFYKSAL